MNRISIYHRLCSKYTNRVIPTRNIYRLNLWNKRFVELPPYHPKYKKPELVYDLNLDWRKYRGLWWLIPVPPKARPACYIFTAFISLECAAWNICHWLSLRD